MLEAERFRLHRRYHSPRFKYGAVVEDLLRGPVRIVALSDAKIPWPIGQKGGAKSLVLFNGLAKAVGNEAAQAIQHWWGIGSDRVWKWRKALGAAPINDGTRRLKVRYSKEPLFKRAQRKAWAKAHDPKRRAKIAATMAGKQRPPSVVAKIAAAKRGTRHSLASRQKMSKARVELWLRPPLADRRWTAQHDEWLRTLPAAEVAKRTGRTIRAVWSRRRKLGLPDGRVKANRQSAKMGGSV